MFADSLLDSPWASRSRRGWSALASFAGQAVAVGSLLLLPLIYTSGLPQFPLSTPSLLAATSPAPRAAAHARTTTPRAKGEPNVVGMVAPQSALPARSNLGTSWPFCPLPISAD